MFCLTCACGGRLSAARSEFAAGHYAAAKQDLVAAEGARHSWPICDRAVYALYRGLTHGALGDAAGATLWLREAYDLEARHPGCLGHDGDARLQVVLRTYGLSP